MSLHLGKAIQALCNHRKFNTFTDSKSTFCRPKTHRSFLRSYCTKPNDAIHSQTPIQVRTRFAPSPTGMMHIGGLRTALFNYLLSHQNNGKFLLRIEDTDQTRIVEGSKENLIEVLEWAGIPYDEGPGKDGGKGPYIQSERFSMYGKYAEQLLKEGKAYRCFCSSERLDALRSSQLRRGVPAMYDRFCLRLNPSQIEEKLRANHPHVIRMKVPPGTTVVEDGVMGQISVQNNVVDDQVLLKSDKFPTYHLANVVDDHFMEISHVIRGEEWLPSTPKHLMLYKAFGWNPPKFIHLPLLLNPDRTKLSKRQSHTSVNWYKEQGYMPEAVINFVALLGWNPGNDDYQEVFTLDQLLQKFSMSNVNKSGAAVNLQKLDWLNSQHVRLMVQQNPSQLVERIRPYLDKRLSELAHSKTSKDFDESYIIGVLKSMEESRFNTLPDLVERCLLFFTAPDYGSAVSQQYLESIHRPYSAEIVKTIIAGLEKIVNEPAKEWNKTTASEFLKSIFDSLKPNVKGIKKPDVFQITRYALSGTGEGSEVPIMMGQLGPKQSLDRFTASLRSIEDKQISNS